MSDESDSPNKVTILAADYSMLRKLGGISLDKILSPEVIKEAETIITGASSELYNDCVDTVAKLQASVDRLKERGGITDSTLKDIISDAFSAKTKAGLAGFDLVAALAKSLQILCEQVTITELATATIQIIEWHMQSIGQLLALKVKGDGGQAGKEILSEIERLKH